MPRKKDDRPSTDDETRLRRALGGAPTPIGLRERILAALDEVDRRSAAGRTAGARRAARPRSKRRGPGDRGR